MNLWVRLWITYWTTVLSLPTIKRDGVVYGTDVSSGHVGPDNVVSLASHPKYIFHQSGESKAHGHQQATHL